MKIAAIQVGIKREESRRDRFGTVCRALEELRREAGALRAVTYGLPAVDKQAVDKHAVGDFPRGDALIRTIEKEFVSREQRRTDGAAPDSLQE